MEQDFDWIQVQGESMRPFLRSGDWVGVSWCAGAQARQAFSSGDLVLGRGADNVWLVHRLVGIETSGSYVLKGDASIMTERLDLDEIWGRVVAIRGSSASAKSTPLRTTFLDRVIARLSRLKLRRTVFTLGTIRRAALWR